MSDYSILIMEDNEDINLLIKATLSFKGFNVHTSYNGTDGIEIAKKEKLDLIILDVMMPDMDGYQVLEKLKTNDSTKNIPVAFLSAKTQKEEIEKGLALGAINYFTKPFEPMEFLSQIEEILEN